jgi:hypothetical protein
MNASKADVRAYADLVTQLPLTSLQLVRQIMRPEVCLPATLKLHTGRSAVQHASLRQKPGLETPNSR